MNRFLCLDCGVDTNAINEYYMLKYAVWRQATGESPDGMLCIGCVEKRIGRQLQLNDFTEHMEQHNVNRNGFTLSARLKDRLGRT